MTKTVLAFLPSTKPALSLPMMMGVRETTSPRPERFFGMGGRPLIAPISPFHTDRRRTHQPGFDTPITKYGEKILPNIKLSDICTRALIGSPTTLMTFAGQWLDPASFSMVAACQIHAMLCPVPHLAPHQVAQFDSALLYLTVVRNPWPVWSISLNLG